MEQHTPPPSPASLPDRARWTPSKQRIFLSALMETGSVTAAARAAGMTRSSAQRLRKRLAGTPFDLTWSAALSQHAARLADPFGSRAPAAAMTPRRSAAAADPRPR